MAAGCTNPGARSPEPRIDPRSHPQTALWTGQRCPQGLSWSPLVRWATGWHWASWGRGGSHAHRPSPCWSPGWRSPTCWARAS
uniref:Prostaglandin I2 receptor n=1 Tax=Molossus molossus TaxID=27622 RepID=A0A7J8CAF7_MOLMO|nr:prostaglandin I2 receptor [Molossus molossus]